MKRKDLYDYIREEIINELTSIPVTSTNVGDVKKKISTAPGLNTSQKAELTKTATPGSTITLPENELEEARKAGSFKIGDSTKFKEAKELYSVGLYGSILNAIEAAGEEGLTQKGLGEKLGIKNDSALNPILNKFKAIGVLGGGKLAKAEKPEKTTTEPEAEEPEVDDFYATDIEDETPEEKPVAVGDKETEKITGDIDISKSEETNKATNIIKNLSAKIKDMKKGPEREKKMAALKQFINNNKKVLRGLDINKLTDGLIGGGGD